jgi:DNA-binding IscR family transcriptional regulator
MLNGQNLKIKEILKVLEPNMFESTDACCDDPVMNRVLNEQVFDPIQKQLEETLESLTLESLVSHVVDRRQETPMFYI